MKKRKYYFAIAMVLAITSLSACASTVSNENN